MEIAITRVIIRIMTTITRIVRSPFAHAHGVGVELLVELVQQPNRLACARTVERKTRKRDFVHVQNAHTDMCMCPCVVSVCACMCPCARHPRLCMDL